MDGGGCELAGFDFGGPIYFERRNGLMEVAYPRFNGSEVNPGGDTNRRSELARIIMAGTRTQVADAAVNRMWGHPFRHGFTKPGRRLSPPNPSSLPGPPHA